MNVLHALSHTTQNDTLSHIHSQHTHTLAHTHAHTHSRTHTHSPKGRSVDIPTYVHCELTKLLQFDGHFHFCFKGILCRGRGDLSVARWLGRESVILVTCKVGK